MTDAPDTSDLNPASVTTRAGLTALLHEVHVRADRPSLRTLEARTSHYQTPLSKTVLSELLNGARFPRRAVMLGFLRACGVPEDQLKPWGSAWDKVSSGALSPAELMWHFPDGKRITLVCYELQPEFRPPQADLGHLNYVRLAGLADIDSLIDIHGAIRAYNPDSTVSIIAAEKLRPPETANHLVVIGGRAWSQVMPWFSRIFPVPIKAEDPGDRGAIVVSNPDGTEREFKCTYESDELVEDVGFFVRGKNPAAPLRTLTIIGGITTRGVRGTALCFIDPEMRSRNADYLNPRFPEGSTYCIVMKVPVVNKEPWTPDLSIAENRLFEWSESGAKAM